MTNILSYLECSAADYPSKIAFADESSSCTYQELLLSAQAVGTSLANHTSPGSPVPVLMEKSVDAIVAFMGVVYAGCFYILLDSSQPEARLNQILDTLNPEVLLVGKNSQGKHETLDFAGKAILLEDACETPVDQQKLSAIRKQGLDTDPLYGIFTSGSTGTPKGVVVSHRSVIDFVEHFTELFDITSVDVIGNQAPFDFDVSVKDIYSTLKTGATMEIIPKKLFSMPSRLLDYLCEREVTTLIWAVSALCIITTLRGFEYRVPEKVNKVLFSGEVMPIKHLSGWQENLPHASFVNLYGPTEITCNCTYYKIDKTFVPGEVLPIGVPFPNEKVFLLDGDNHLVQEPGQLGELCVSGTALALGYYNNKEQTNRAFVQNPLNTRYPEMIYRTGDLAYYGDDGQLYFSSRKDFQIKHMGHRIELGEIEAALEKVTEIRRLCCIFDEEKKRIVAFYEGDVGKKEIVREIGATLPPYMIPNRFHPIDVMPLTANGKIDRKALMTIYKGE